MAVALHVYKIDEDGECRIEHIAYGETPEEARRNYQEHAAQCPSLTKAEEEDRTEEEFEYGVDAPEFDDDEEGDEDEGEEEGQ